MLCVPDQTCNSDNFRSKWQPVQVFTLNVELHSVQYSAVHSVQCTHATRLIYEAFIMRGTDLLHSFIHWRSGCKASWYDASFGLDPSSLLNQRYYHNIENHIPTTSLPFEVPAPPPQIYPAKCKPVFAVYTVKHNAQKLLNSLTTSFLRFNTLVQFGIKVCFPWYPVISV